MDRGLPPPLPVGSCHLAMPLVRLQKYLADAGVASRRAAERLIIEGKVTVNGQQVNELGSRVDPEAAKVEVNGERVRPRRKIYAVLHKPRGFICTRNDPEKRPIVLELLPKEWGILHPVGRLDCWSEGLLFLTNDGDFTLRLTHPRFGVKKRYVARVIGNVHHQQLKAFTEGVRDGGELLRAESARLVSANNSHSVIELELAEGRNREVRRMFELIGFEVERLQRVQIGKIKLGELPVGKWRVLTPPEIKSLLQGAG